MTKARAAILALISAAAAAAEAACKDVHVVQRESLTAERFFFVVLDGAGEVREVSAVYETQGAEQVTFDLLGDADEVLVVGLADTRLAAIDARFDRRRSATLSAFAGAPPAPAQLFFRDEAAFVRTAVPAEAQIIDARENRDATSDARQNVERGVSIEVPIDLEECARDHPMHLEPFGAVAELLAGVPAELTGQRYTMVLRLTGAMERALMLTSGALYAVGRGEAIDLAPVLTPGDPSIEAKAISADALGAGVTLRSIAAYPRSVNGESLFLLAGDQNGEAALWQILLTSNGMRVLQRAAFGDAPPRSLIRDVMFDGQGIAVAVGDAGLVLTSETLTMAWTRVETPTGAEGEIRRAAASNILTQPHAIATENALYLGYAWQGYWDAITLEAPANAIAATLDGDELWVASDRGVIARRKDSAFARIALTYPASLADCGTREAETNRVLIDDALSGAAIDEAFVYVQAQHCTAMTRVRRSDLCVSPIEFGGIAAHASGGRTAIGAWGDTVVVGGENGLLLTVAR